MTIDQGTIAASFTGNLFSDKWYEESKFLRRVKRIAVVGGNAINQNKWQLKYGDKIIAEFWNIDMDGR